MKEKIEKKYKSKFSLPLKCVSLALAVLMLVQDFSFAAAEAVLGPRNIEVSSALGTVTHLSESGQPEMIINIQDAHANLGAQESITKILDELVSKYDLKMIALEGGWGQVDTSILSSFPVKEAREKTARKFLEQGKISAGEFYSIVSGSDIRLYGVDDEKLYLENLEAFRYLIDHKIELKAEFIKIQSILGTLEQENLSTEILARLEPQKTHRKGQLSFSDYWKQLKAGTGSFRSYPALTKMDRVIRLEKAIDFKKANSEREKLVNALSLKVSGNDLKQLVLKSLEFKKNQMPAGEFYPWLMSFARRSGMDLRISKNLLRYSRYVGLYDGINLLSLLDELEKFEEESLNEMADDSQREILDLAKQTRLILRLLDVSLEGKDYLLFSGQFSGISPLALEEKFSTFFKRKGQGLPESFNQKLLSDCWEKAKLFYEMADRRNKMLLENTKKRMRQEGVKVAALVTGGFHTTGLTDLMNQDKVSCLVVMPKFDEKSPDRPYVTVLTKKPKELEETLKSSDWYLAPNLPFQVPDNPENGGSFREFAHDAFDQLMYSQGRVQPSTAAIYSKTYGNRRRQNFVSGDLLGEWLDPYLTTGAQLNIQTPSLSDGGYYGGEFGLSKLKIETAAKNLAQLAQKDGLKAKDLPALLNRKIGTLFGGEIILSQDKLKIVARAAEILDEFSSHAKLTVKKEEIPSKKVEARLTGELAEKKSSNVADSGGAALLTELPEAQINSELSVAKGARFSQNENRLLRLIRIALLRSLPLTLRMVIHQSPDLSSNLVIISVVLGRALVFRLFTIDSLQLSLSMRDAGDLVDQFALEKVGFRVLPKAVKADTAFEYTSIPASGRLLPFGLQKPEFKEQYLKILNFLQSGKYQVPTFSKDTERYVLGPWTFEGRTGELVILKHTGTEYKILEGANGFVIPPGTLTFYHKISHREAMAFYLTPQGELFPGESMWPAVKEIEPGALTQSQLLKALTTFDTPELRKSKEAEVQARLTSYFDGLLRFLGARLVSGVSVTDPTGDGEVVDIQGVTEAFFAGDIQGNADEFEAALKKAGLIDDNGDWAASSQRRLLFQRRLLLINGDMFDRGPKSWQVWELVLKLERQAQEVGDAVVLIRGNHEDLLREAFTTPGGLSWSSLYMKKFVGGQQTLMSILGVDTVADLPPDGTADAIYAAMDPDKEMRVREMINRLGKLPYGFRVNGAIGGSHAGGPSNKPFEAMFREPEEKLRATDSSIYRGDRSGWAENPESIQKALDDNGLKFWLVGHDQLEQNLAPGSTEQGLIRSLPGLPSVISLVTTGGVAEKGGAFGLLKVTFDGSAIQKVSTVYGPNQIGLEDEEDLFSDPATMTAAGSRFSIKNWFLAFMATIFIAFFSPQGPFESQAQSVNTTAHQKFEKLLTSMTDIERMKRDKAISNALANSPFGASLDQANTSEDIAAIKDLFVEAVARHDWFQSFDGILILPLSEKKDYQVIPLPNGNGILVLNRSSLDPERFLKSFAEASIDLQEKAFLKVARMDPFEKGANKLRNPYPGIKERALSDAKELAEKFRNKASEILDKDHSFIVDVTTIGVEEKLREDAKRLDKDHPLNGSLIKFVNGYLRGYPLLGRADIRQEITRRWNDLKKSLPKEFETEFEIKTQNGRYVYDLKLSGEQGGAENDFISFFKNLQGAGFSGARLPFKKVIVLVLAAIILGGTLLVPFLSRDSDSVSIAPKTGAVSVALPATSPTVNAPTAIDPETLSPASAVKKVSAPKASKVFSAPKKNMAPALPKINVSSAATFVVSDAQKYILAPASISGAGAEELSEDAPISPDELPMAKLEPIEASFDLDGTLRQLEENSEREETLAQAAQESKENLNGGVAISVVGLSEKFGGGHQIGAGTDLTNRLPGQGVIYNPKAKFKKDAEKAQAETKQQITSQKAAEDNMLVVELSNKDTAAVEAFGYLDQANKLIENISAPEVRGEIQSAYHELKAIQTTASQTVAVQTGVDVEAMPVAVAGGGGDGGEGGDGPPDEMENFPKMANPAVLAALSNLQALLSDTENSVNFHHPGWKGIAPPALQKFARRLAPNQVSVSVTWFNVPMPVITPGYVAFPKEDPAKLAEALREALTQASVAKSQDSLPSLFEQYARNLRTRSEIESQFHKALSGTAPQDAVSRRRTAQWIAKYVPQYAKINAAEKNARFALQLRGVPETALSEIENKNKEEVALLANRYSDESFNRDFWLKIKDKANELLNKIKAKKIKKYEPVTEALEQIVLGQLPQASNQDAGPAGSLDMPESLPRASLTFSSSFPTATPTSNEFVTSFNPNASSIDSQKAVTTAFLGASATFSIGGNAKLTQETIQAIKNANQAEAYLAKTAQDEESRRRQIVSENLQAKLRALEEALKNSPANSLEALELKTQAALTRLAMDEIGPVQTAASANQVEAVRPELFFSGIEAAKAVSELSKVKKITLTPSFSGQQSYNRTSQAGYTYFTMFHPMNAFGKWLAGLFKKGQDSSTSNEILARQIALSKSKLYALKTSFEESLRSLKEAEAEWASLTLAPAGKSEADRLDAKLKLDLARREQSRLQVQVKAFDDFFASSSPAAFKEELAQFWKTPHNIEIPGLPGQNTAASSFTFTSQLIGTSTLNSIQPAYETSVFANLTFGPGFSLSYTVPSQNPDDFLAQLPAPSQDIDATLASAENENLSVITLTRPEAVAKAITQSRVNALISKIRSVKAPIFQGVSANGFLFLPQTSIGLPESQAGVWGSLQVNLTNFVDRLFFGGKKQKLFYQAQIAAVEHQSKKDYSRTLAQLRRLSNESRDLVQKIKQTRDQIASASDPDSQKETLKNLELALLKNQAQLRSFLLLISPDQNTFSGISGVALSPFPWSLTAGRSAEAILPEPDGARLDQTRPSVSIAEHILSLGARLCGVANTSEAPMEPQADYSGESLVPNRIASNMVRIFRYVSARGSQEDGLVFLLTWPLKRMKKLPAVGIPVGVQGVIEPEDRIGGVLVKALNKKPWFRLNELWPTLRTRILGQAQKLTDALAKTGFTPLPQGVIQADGHSRYATVQGQMIEEAAHPHTRGPERFLREDNETTDLETGGAVTHESMLDLIGLFNGDQDAAKYFGRVLGTGELAEYIARVTHYPDGKSKEKLVQKNRVPTFTGNGDAPILMEMVRFHLTKSIWYKSALYAYQRKIAQSHLDEAPSQEELTIWSVLFREVFTQFRGEIYDGKNLPLEQVQDTDALNRFADELVLRISQEKAKPGFSKLNVDQARLREFVQEVVYVYMNQGMFEALIRQLETARGVDGTTETISMLYSLEWNKRGYAAYKQGLTLVYDPDQAEQKIRYYAASDLRGAVSSAGENAMVLELNSGDGEVVEVQVQKDFRHARIYSFKPGPNGVKGLLSEEEVAARWRPVSEVRELLAEETSETHINPVITDQNHVVPMVAQIHDRMNAVSAQDQTNIDIQNQEVTQYFVKRGLDKLRAFEVFQRQIRKAGVQRQAKPAALDYVFLGTENSLYHLRLFASAMNAFFGNQLNILVLDQNEFLEKGPSLHMDDETDVVIVSRSGQTSQSVSSASASSFWRDPVNRVKNFFDRSKSVDGSAQATIEFLQRKKENHAVGEVFFMTRDGVNDVTKAMGNSPHDKKTVWISGETYSFVDATSLVPAVHQMFTEIFLRFLKAANAQGLVITNAENTPLTSKDLAIMDAINHEEVHTALPEIMGRTADGEDQPTVLSREIEKLGRVIGINIKEWGQAFLLLVTYVIVTVPSDITHLRPIFNVLFGFIQNSDILLTVGHAVDLLIQYVFSLFDINFSYPLFYNLFSEIKNSPTLPTIAQVMDMLVYAFAVPALVWARRWKRGDQVRAKMGPFTVIYINAKDVYSFVKIYMDKLFSQAPGWMSAIAETGDALLGFLQEHGMKFGRGKIIINFMQDGELVDQMGPGNIANNALSLDDHAAAMKRDRSANQTAVQMQNSSGVQFKTGPRVVLFLFGDTDPGMRGAWWTIRLPNAAKNVFTKLGQPDNPDAVAAFIRTRIHPLTGLVAIEKTLAWSAVEALKWRFVWWGNRVLRAMYLAPVGVSQDNVVVASTRSPRPPLALGAVTDVAVDLTEAGLDQVRDFFTQKRIKTVEEEDFNFNPDVQLTIEDGELVVVAGSSGGVRYVFGHAENSPAIYRASLNRREFVGGFHVYYLSDGSKFLVNANGDAQFQPLQPLTAWREGRNGHEKTAIDFRLDEHLLKQLSSLIKNPAGARLTEDSGVEWITNPDQVVTGTVVSGRVEEVKWKTGDQVIQGRVSRGGPVEWLGPERTVLGRVVSSVPKNNSIGLPESQALTVTANKAPPKTAFQKLRTAFVTTLSFIILFLSLSFYKIPDKNIPLSVSPSQSSPEKVVNKTQPEVVTKTVKTQNSKIQKGTITFSKTGDSRSFNLSDIKKVGYDKGYTYTDKKGTQKVKLDAQAKAFLKSEFQKDVTAGHVKPIEKSIEASSVTQIENNSVKVELGTTSMVKSEKRDVENKSGGYSTPAIRTNLRNPISNGGPAYSVNGGSGVGGGNPPPPPPSKPLLNNSYPVLKVGIVLSPNATSEDAKKNFLKTVGVQIKGRFELIFSKQVKTLPYASVVTDLQSRGAEFIVNASDLTENSIKVVLLAELAKADAQLLTEVAPLLNALTAAQIDALNENLLRGLAQFYANNPIHPETLEVSGSGFQRTPSAALSEDQAKEIVRLARKLDDALKNAFFENSLTGKSNELKNAASEIKSWAGQHGSVQDLLDALSRQHQARIVAVDPSHRVNYKEIKALVQDLPITTVTRSEVFEKESPEAYKLRIEHMNKALGGHIQNVLWVPASAGYQTAQEYLAAYPEAAIFNAVLIFDASNVKDVNTALAKAGIQGGQALILTSEDGIVAVSDPNKDFVFALEKGSSAILSLERMIEAFGSMKKNIHPAYIKVLANGVYLLLKTVQPLDYKEVISVANNQRQATIAA